MGILYPTLFSGRFNPCSVWLRIELIPPLARVEDGEECLDGCLVAAEAQDVGDEGGEGVLEHPARCGDEGSPHMETRVGRILAGEVEEAVAVLDEALALPEPFPGVGIGPADQAPKVAA